MGFGHLLPEREDSYPAYQGYGEIKNDLHGNDDDMNVVEVVDVEEEDDEDADKIDGKVERHPDKRGKDELVSGLADAKDQQAACHNRDHRDEDVDAFKSQLDAVQLLGLLHRLAEPGVVLLEADFLQAGVGDSVQGLGLHNEAADEDDDVEQVEDDRDYGDRQTTSLQLRG